MVISVFLIAVLSYALSLVDVCGMVSRLAFKDPLPADASVDYFYLYRKHRWMGVGYALVADLLRALITVLIGGMLLKNAGFPSVGKLLALMFSLIGQAMPLLPLRRQLASKRELIFPALTLLFVDWRIFLVCVALAVLVMALTGSRAMMAAAVAVAMPIFTLIFRGWWLKIVLAVFCALALIYCYWDELAEAFMGGGKKKPAAKRRPADGRDDRPGGRQ
jgi:hypothetical protein